MPADEADLAALRYHHTLVPAAVHAGGVNPRYHRHTPRAPDRQPLLATDVPGATCHPRSMLVHYTPGSVRPRVEKAHGDACTRTRSFCTLPETALSDCNWSLGTLRQSSQSPHGFDFHIACGWMVHDL